MDKEFLIALQRSAHEKGAAYCNWLLEDGEFVLRLQYELPCILDVEGWPQWDLARQAYEIRNTDGWIEKVLLFQQMAHATPNAGLTLNDKYLPLTELDRIMDNTIAAWRLKDLAP
jgi:hypothetical protein